MLSETGWKVTHRIECPLSSERMSGDQVQKMQEKRILGTIGRSLIIARPCLGPTQTIVYLGKVRDAEAVRWIENLYA